MHPKTRCKAICHSYYMLFGLAGTGIIFPLVRSFEHTYGLTHTQVGALMGAGSPLFAVSALISGYIFDAYGPRWVLSLSAACCALSALAIWGASATLSFAAAFLLFRFSSGSTSAVNPFVGQLYEEKRTQGLNLLHAFQAVGRLLAPLLVAACIWASGGWKAVFLVAAVLFTIWAFLCFLGIRAASCPPVPVSSEIFDLRQAARYLSDVRVLLGNTGFVFCGGCELVIATWVPNFLETEAGFTKQVALLSLAAIWAGYTAIRTLVGLRRKGVGSRFIICSIFLLLIALFAVVNTHSAFPLYIFSFALGMSFGAHWPSMAVMMYDSVTGAHGILTGMFIIASMIGSALFVSATGWLGDAFSLKHALMIAPFCGIVYAAIYCSLPLFARNRRLS